MKMLPVSFQPPRVNASNSMGNKVTTKKVDFGPPGLGVSGSHEVITRPAKGLEFRNQEPGSGKIKTDTLTLDPL